MSCVRLRAVLIGLALSGPSACVFWDDGNWSTNFGQRGLADGSTDEEADVRRDGYQGDTADTQAPTPISPGQFAVGVSLDAGNWLTGSFLEPVSGGDTIVVVLYFSTSPGLMLEPVTDNVGNHYEMEPAIVEAEGAAAALLAYATNVDGGSVTVSANFKNAAVTGLIFVNEYAGLDPSLPLDSYDASTGIGTGMGSMITGGSVQTKSARGLLFAFVQSDTLLSTTPSPGFRVQATGTGAFDEFKLVTHEGMYSAAFISNGNGPWVSLIAAFH